MHHIVYLITNLVNSKIYIGVHSTYNLDDGYLGSGTGIKRAIKKYQKENFRKQILYYCLDAADAYQIESNIVDKNFISRKNTYNNMTGSGSYSQKCFSIETRVRMSKPKNLSKEQRSIMSQRVKGKTYVDRFGEEKATLVINKLKTASSGQNNPASKTRMSAEKLKAKGQKTKAARLANGTHNKGKNNPKAKIRVFINHNKKIIYIVNGTAEKFIAEFNFSSKWLKYVNTGKITANLKFLNDKTKISAMAMNNWEITSFDFYEEKIALSLQKYRKIDYL